METILIHPESAEQLKTVKAVLKALKVKFEAQSSSLPPHISKSIEKGIAQYESGQTISMEEFTERHFFEEMNFEIKFTPEAEDPTITS